MQIQTNLNMQKNPFQELFSAKQGVNKVQQAPETKQITQEIHSSLKENENKRQTYGFLVLELMSDSEYQAFQRATAGMSESEKMMAAQSLYSLTNFYNGNRKNKNLNLYDTFNVQDFITRYKNASITQNQIDLNT
ncbi:MULTISPECIES: hypothetical protein [unclassified Helicobacter]|uniref:hypothetical protein n=1 Tax=unclassified Helicobacter TaxID=2593540 RepID=UPI000CF19C32